MSLMSSSSTEPDLPPLPHLLPAVELRVPCHSCGSAFPPRQCQETKRNPDLLKNTFFASIRELFTYKNSQRQISGENKEHKQHKIEVKNGSSLIQYTLCSCISEYYSFTRQPTQQFSKGLAGWNWIKYFSFPSLIPHFTMPWAEYSPSITQWPALTCFHSTWLEERNGKGRSNKAFLFLCSWRRRKKPPLNHSVKNLAHLLRPAAMLTDIIPHMCLDRGVRKDP